MDIHAGAEDIIYVVAPHLEREEFEQLGIEVLVKGRCKTCAVRKRESLLSAVESHSRRTVVAADCGDAVTHELLGYASESGRRTCSNSRAAHSLTSYDETEILVRELSNELIHRIPAVLNVRKLDALIAGLLDISGDVLHPLGEIIVLSNGNGLICAALIKPVKALDGSHCGL